MKCSYCSKEVRKGTGTMFVHKTGAISYFCSGRCYKNSIILQRKINRKEMRVKQK